MGMAGLDFVPGGEQLKHPITEKLHVIPCYRFVAVCNEHYSKSDGLKATLGYRELSNMFSDCVIVFISQFDGQVTELVDSYSDTFSSVSVLTDNANNYLLLGVPYETETARARMSVPCRKKELGVL